MSLAVTPFGVLAAIYLREYAKQGLFVRAVRIAINNLAGVPSIVFGIFGLGFFVYFLGGNIDQLFFPRSVELGVPTFGTGGVLWASLTLALMTVPVVIVATEEALAAVSRGVREGALACGASNNSYLGVAGFGTGHFDRFGARHGAWRGGGGPVDVGRSRRIGPKPSDRWALPLHPLRTQVHAPRVPYL